MPSIISEADAAARASSSPGGSSYGTSWCHMTKMISSQVGGSSSSTSAPACDASPATRGRRHSAGRRGDAGGRCRAGILHSGGRRRANRVPQHESPVQHVGVGRVCAEVYDESDRGDKPAPVGGWSSSTTAARPQGQERAGDRESRRHSYPSLYPGRCRRARDARQRARRGVRQTWMLPCRPAETSPPRDAVELRRAVRNARRLCDGVVRYATFVGKDVLLGAGRNRK